MYYGEIKKVDIANGPGVRVSLFVSGCTHHCVDCFNAETWNPRFGQEFTEKTKEEILEALAPEHIAGLTVLGGEPFEPDNQRALLPLLREVRERFPEKSIWVYSGYLFDKEIQSTLPAGTVLPPDKAVEALLPGEGVNVLIVESGRERAEVWYRCGTPSPRAAGTQKPEAQGEDAPAEAAEQARARRRAMLHRAIDQAGDDLMSLSPEKVVIRLGAPYRSANCEATEELLSLIDVLVDGKFIRMEKDLSLRFRGSRNQRLIDVKASRAAGGVTLWEPS